MSSAHDVGTTSVPSSSPVSDVEIVDFDAALLDKAARLRAAVFGGSVALNHDYLDWKYLRNPYLVDPLACFAVSADRIVGMYGGMGSCWEHGGTRHVLSHGGDVMVDSKLRGRGVARRLQHGYVARLRARDIGIAFSLSGGSMGTPAMVAGGWHVVLMLETLERGKAPRRWRVGTITRRSRALFGRDRPEAAVDPLAAVTSDDDDVRPLGTEASEQLAGIASLAPSSDRLRHVRDAEYFRWRLSNPLSRYCVLATDKAYLILQSSRQGSCVNVVDWRGKDARSLADVLRVGLRNLTHVSVWRFSLDAKLLAMFESSGLLPAAHRRFSSFTIRSVTGDIRDARLAGMSLADPKSWDVRMLDSDRY